MSSITYTQRPRLGPGRLKLVIWMVAAALIAVNVWTGYRIVQGLTDSASGAGPASAEERIVRDAYAAVQQDPKSADARWQLSIALSTVGDYREALDAAEQAVKLDKKKVECYYALGLAYQGLGDKERAEKALTKASSLPGALGEVYRDVYYDLGLLRQDMGDSKGAVQALEAALGNGPEATYIVIALADAYRESGNEKRAIEEYSAALGYDPDNQDIARKLKEMGVSDADIEKARTPIAHQAPSE